MSLSDHDVLLGGDVDPTTGRMRSLAALLVAVREAQGRVGPQAEVRTPAAAAAPVRPPTPAPPQPQPVAQPVARPTVCVLGAGSGTALRPPARTPWVAVIGAHAGAGASTVAVALADAAAAARRPVHLLSCAAPSQCGLLAVPTVELGLDDGGDWRRGRRGAYLVIDRSSGERRDTAPWPETPVRPDLTVVDACDPAWLEPADDQALPVATLVVCRATVPGLQQAEHTLRGLARHGVPVLLAAIGPRRTPRSVHGTSGPLLRELHGSDLTVTVPLDRRLAHTGLSSGPLPRPVAAAGRTLLRHLDAFAPQASSGPSRSASGTSLTKELLS